MIRLSCYRALSKEISFTPENKTFISFRIISVRPFSFFTFLLLDVAEFYRIFIYILDLVIIKLKSTSGTKSAVNCGINLHRVFKAKHLGLQNLGSIL